MPSPLTAILTPNDFIRPAAVDNDTSNDTSNTFPFHSTSSSAAIATEVSICLCMLATLLFWHHGTWA